MKDVSCSRWWFDGTKRASGTVASLCFAFGLASCAPHDEPVETRSLVKGELLAPDVFTQLNGNEPHLAVSPIDPNIVAAALFRTVSLSFDGGRTFLPGNVINAPLPATHGAGGGDPAVAFDNQGRLFFTYLALVANVMTPGFGGPDLFVQQIDPRPTGNVPSRLVDAAGNDCTGAGANANECPIFVTGALNLNLPAANDVNGSPSSHDRQWLAVDAQPACPVPAPPRANRICSTSSNNLYLIWTDFLPTGTAVRVASSATQGSVGSWTQQIISVPAEGFAQQVHMAVAANGDVWAAYHAQPAFSAQFEPDGASGQIVTLVSTNGTAAGFGGRSTPFAPGQADITFNRQQCPCGNGTCNANPAIACNFFSTTCPGPGCQCGAGDFCVPPAGCANNPIPGWQACSRRLPASQSLTQGSAMPFVVTDSTNPNNIAVVASQDPNIGVPGDNFDVGVSIATDAATAATPTWSGPQAVLPGGAPLPAFNQLFPQGASGSGDQCVTLMYYDDRNPNPSVNGNSLLDVFVTVTPNLWAAGGPVWGPETPINTGAFDPDIGNVGADFNSFCGNPPPMGCVEPAGWRVTNRMGEYNGLVHARGVAFVANGPGGVAQRAVFDFADGIAPVVTAPGPTSVNTCLPTDAQLGTASATDTCGLPPLSAPTSNITPSTRLNIGANTVTWSSTDGADNVGQATQSVTVSDNAGPFFSIIPPDLTTTRCTNVAIGQAFAEDDCGGTVTISNNAPNTFPLGTTTVTWTATDQRGNSRTATQRVTVLLGNDAACCPAGTNIIQGTSNNDTLNGGAGSDCILGRGAQDTINGNGGNDFISGGDGDDNITGGTGNDFIFGGSGQDMLNGNAGNDTLFGMDGDDTLLGGTGNDTLRGGQGQDLLQGQDNDDTLFGDIGDDNLQGGNGNDNMSGGQNGPGHDTCTDAVGVNTFALCELGGNPDSCANGVTDGLETGVDCGGGCAPCSTNQTCQSAGDCLSHVCSAMTCQDLLFGVRVTPVVDTDWGGGFCVHLDVTNVKDIPTTNWSATLNTNQSTIFTSWNATFTPSSGTISVTPNLGFREIDPEETSVGIGFCANRNVSTSGLLPFATSATGVY